MALHQHLGDGGGGSEVAVNLERWVGVEEVGQRFVAQEVGEEFVGAVAIAETGPEVDFPGEGPAGGTVTADIQRLAGGGEEVGGGWSDLVGREETVEVGDVAVTLVGLRVFLDPFHEASVAGDADGCQSAQGILATATEGGIGTEDLFRSDAVFQKFADDLEVHGGTIGEDGGAAVREEEFVFGRVRGIGDQFSGDGAASGGFDEEIENELGGPPHDGPGALAKEGLVLGEKIVLPRVGGQPGSPHRPDTMDSIRGGRAAPSVRKMVDHPAARAVGGLGGAGAGFDEAFDEVDERQFAIGQTGEVGRPVVHLEIDVGMEVGVPRGPELPVPDALKVGRQRAWAGTANQQVAAEVVIQGGQRGVGFAFLETGKALVGGDSAGLGGRWHDER